MTRKILLPTDFSENAWYAMNYALELYKNEYCNFYLLNVFSGIGNVMESLINMEPGSELYETAKLESQNSLAKLLDKLAFKGERNPKHHFKTISKFNSTVEAIKIVVEEKDIEMIIMGTKGKTASKKIVYGSVAINVMEKVRNCPVLVVPEYAKLNLPKEIVFPTGYKMNIKRRELKILVDLVSSCKAYLRILHVSEKEKLNDKQLNNKKLLEEYFDTINHSFHKLSHMDIPQAINCFIQSRNSDMVAFLNRKHGFFESIFSNPMVKEMGYDSKVPMLVMHDLKN